MIYYYYNMSMLISKNSEAKAHPFDVYITLVLPSLC